MTTTRDALAAVREKIAKLLRLASSSGASEAEAALAAERAQSLMEQHKLSQLDVQVDEDDDQDTVERSSVPYPARSPRWRGVLWRAIGETTGLLTVHTRSGTIDLFGPTSGILLAIELEGFLRRQIEQLAREYGGTTRAARNGFLCGCASRVCRRLRDAHEARRKAAADVYGSKALVVYDVGAATTALRKSVYPRLTGGGRVRCTDRSAYADGKRAGNRVRLTKPREVGGGRLALTGPTSAGRS